MRDWSLVSLATRAEASWRRRAICSSQWVWLKLASHLRDSWLWKAMRKRLPNESRSCDRPYVSIIRQAALLLEPMPLLFISRVKLRELGRRDLETHSY